ncbi:MAG: BamA/TamA family outer membrane protein [Vicinamibacterales bacterium]|jgi:outer membrane protein assembly complex protein YaeT|nr:hypothetical protein [Acidobacteriota bacterium]MDP6371130.1 BamA/TamA family outer membrane protein [Vicinamibacterales bacterium]MDP6607979.1 BamA/TamA family outer membrane protein [Vicinamibacterales bacterium]HAK54119.1 hypothetical protein [Acidobacteriota bacterium]
MRARAWARGGLVGLVLLGAPATSAGQIDSPLRVRHLTFEGVTAIDESDLRRALETRAWPRFFWGDKDPFDEATFQDDLVRIVEYYGQRGYPEARIADASIQRLDGDRVDLMVVVDEGRPYIVESLELEGFDPLSAAELETLRDRLPLRPGQPLDAVLLEASEQLALFALGNRGYAYAVLDTSNRTGATFRSRRLTLVARPGLLTLFGPIDIVGNTGLGDRLIREDLVYRPGELFRAGLLRESEARLTARALIDAATVEVLPQAGKPGDVFTRIRIEEAEHRQYSLSGGYGSEGQLDLTGDLRHINFFGGGRSAGVSGRWSSLDRGVLIDFVEPRFFDPRYSLRVAGEVQVVDEPTFYTERAGGVLSLTRRFGATWPPDAPRTTASVSYTNSYDEFETSDDFEFGLGDFDDLLELGLNPFTGLGAGRLSALAIDFTRDTTDGSLNPSRGYAANLRFEQAGRWLGGRFTYNEIRADARHFLSLSGRVVLAHRLLIGTIDAPSDSIGLDDFVGPPLYKRYFLGGAESLRGWGRFEIGPRAESGLPLGGLSHLNLQSELRWLLPKGIGAVAFVDAGNAWDQSWRIDLGKLRSAVGVGLRLPTPLGLARIDYGYQLTPIDGLLVEGLPETRHWRLHFRIGQSF